jgi:hypothetical protein
MITQREDWDTAKSTVSRLDRPETKSNCVIGSEESQA